MKCTKHPSDFSSTVGVCASCLRERLFSLIAAQARQQAQAEEDRRKSDAHHPPPLIFPRSVSPYICRRSDHSSWSHQHQQQPNHHHLFYSTPQLGPTFSSTTTTGNKKKHSHKFSLLSTLFKSSRSVSTAPSVPSESSDYSDPRFSSTASPISSSSSSSPSWFSNLISGRRKKKHKNQSRFFSEEFSAPQTQTQTQPRLRRRTDRGMSPSDQEESYEEEPLEYSTESSPGWRKSTPVVPIRRKGIGGSTHSRNVSGMTFCLSPLVRASPNRHRCQKDGLPPGMVVSGDIGRGSSKCHLSTAASLCANRSRKLADFGRYNYNP